MTDDTEPMAELTSDTEQPTLSAPALRIVTPDTTPEEVAAIVAVFAAFGGGATPTPKPRPNWNAPHRMVRQPLAHGPGGWRASALPR